MPLKWKFTWISINIERESTTLADQCKWKKNTVLYINIATRKWCKLLWLDGSSANIWPGLLVHNKTASPCLSANLDFRIVSQILQTNILLLHHPVELSGTVDPNVWLAIVIVIESSSAVASWRSIWHVDLSAVQSFSSAGFHSVRLLQNGSHSYL